MIVSATSSSYPDQQPAQQNCCMDIKAKTVIWGLEGEELPPQDIFPLKPVAVFVGKEKMTSGSEDLLRFSCERIMTREALMMAHKKVQVLRPDQFDEVWWQAATYNGPSAID